MSFFDLGAHAAVSSSYAALRSSCVSPPLTPLPPHLTIKSFSSLGPHPSQPLWSRLLSSPTTEHTITSARLSSLSLCHRHPSHVLHKRRPSFSFLVTPPSSRDTRLQRFLFARLVRFRADARGRRDEPNCGDTATLIPFLIIHFLLSASFMRRLHWSESGV